MRYVLPTGGGQVALFWSLKATALESWRDAGLAAWKAYIAALWPACECLLGRIADPAQLTFARYAHGLERPAIEGRLAHIGVAWHAASPQFGKHGTARCLGAGEGAARNGRAG
jgi:hypothetical protein